MGEMASPGSDTTANTDHIASSTASDMVPFPVLIVICEVSVLPYTSQVSYQKQQGRRIKFGAPANYLSGIIALSRSEPAWRLPCIGRTLR